MQLKNFVMKRVAHIVLVVSLVFVPLTVHGVRDLNQALNVFGGLINQAAKLVLALAILYFVWGMAKFVMNADSDDGRKAGKQIMLWGIVAIFVAVSIWGIIGILSNTFFAPGS